MGGGGHNNETRNHYTHCCFHTFCNSSIMAISILAYSGTRKDTAIGYILWWHQQALMWTTLKWGGEEEGEVADCAEEVKVVHCQWWCCFVASVNVFPPESTCGSPLLTPFHKIACVPSFQGGGASCSLIGGRISTLVWHLWGYRLNTWWFSTMHLRGIKLSVVQAPQPLHVV